MKRILLPILLALTLSASAGQRKIFIVQTSDTHSCIEPISPNFSDTAQANKAGYMRRAALLERLRREYPTDLLLFDCGDFSQGSAYYNLFKGEVEIKLMNEMRYDACTIGNHEFDFGLENMARLFRMASFPIVCCNYDFRGTPVDGLVKPYIIIERAGVRVGVLGVAPQLEGLVAKQSYGDTRYTPPIQAAQPVVDRLRNEEHCDLVICLSHLGWGDEPDHDKGFIRATTGIDVVLGGHSHTYSETLFYETNKAGQKVPVDHEGKHGVYVGKVTLTFDKK